jgi:hypothetical protein
MRSQNVTASKRNVRFLPWVFTEHGALMAANVLNSERAILMSVELINAADDWKMPPSLEQLLDKMFRLKKKRHFRPFLYPGHRSHLSIRWPMPAKPHFLIRNQQVTGSNNVVVDDSMYVSNLGTTDLIRRLTQIDADSGDRVRCCAAITVKFL